MSDEQKYGASIELLYPILVGVTLERDDPEGESGESEAFFGGSIQLMPVDEAIHMAQCRFRAGEQKKTKESEVEVVSVSADYIIGFRSGDKLEIEHKKIFLKQIAESSAWPLFRSLFSLVLAQTTKESQTLPRTIDCDWMEDQE
jgi:hypothetical protein